jgi:hypothetical protein
MMDPPLELMSSVPAEACPAVERWWQSLSQSDRQQLTDAWDERHETRFFKPLVDAEGRPDVWETIPRVTGGRFVPHDDSVRMHEWLEDRAEYLAGHEEIILLPRVVIVYRTFFICHAEPAARAVTETGTLPADFQCTARSNDCPMRRVRALAPGRTQYLTAAAQGGWWLVAPWPALNRSAV